MALVKCKECGNEVSDKADKCPNCGCPVSYSIENVEETKEITNNDELEEWKPSAEETVTNHTKDNKKKDKKKDSKLSIWAAVLSLFTCTYFIGFILAIIDLCTAKSKDKEEKHTGSWFAIIFGIILTIVLVSGGDDKDKVATTEAPTEITTEVTTENITTEETTEVKETEEEYRETCEEYKFKDVLRNPDDYIGKRVKVTIQINSVHEESILNATKYYFGYSENEYGYYGDYYAIFDERENQDLKLLSSDTITVYGEIAEPEYTSSLILSSEEVFAIKMKYVDLIAE